MRHLPFFLINSIPNQELLYFVIVIAIFLDIFQPSVDMIKRLTLIYIVDNNYSLRVSVIGLSYCTETFLTSRVPNHHPNELGII